MLGTFRLALAMIVVVYHSGVMPFGWHIGVSAVVAFFVVSGFAMSGLVRKHFASADKVGHFYAERFTRLAPQYYFYLVISAIGVLAFGLTSNFTEAQLTPAIALAHMLAISPNMIRRFVPDLQHYQLIPQAWSISTEICFYAVFPWLLMWRRGIAVACAASLSVFGLATAGIISPDAFSYRLIFGTLVFFLAGHFIYQRNWIALAIVGAGLAANFLVVSTCCGFEREFNGDIYRGAVLGIVGVVALRALASSAWDDLAGAASYGAYLNHMIIIIALRHLGVAAGSQFAFTMIALVLAVGFGFASYWFVERPTVAFRRSWRPGSVRTGRGSERGLPVAR